MHGCHKRKAPVTGGFRFQLVRRIGFRASASRIRTGFARLPARSPARYGRSASASRSRLDRGSNPWDAGVKEKPPLPEALSSNGAAYRIRTYDVLIRSQTLYPAEVTPQRKTYKTTLVSWSQAQSQTFWRICSSRSSACANVPHTINRFFNYIEPSTELPQKRAHPLGTVIIGKRDAQHARDLVRSSNTIEVLKDNKRLMRHKRLDHMRRLLIAPLRQWPLTRLPNHQATHTGWLTRNRETFPTFIALKQNYPLIKQLHRIPFLSLLFNKSIAGRCLYTERLFVCFLLSCPRDMVKLRTQKGRPRKERPCKSLMQATYATGSIFSRPPM